VAFFEAFRVMALAPHPCFVPEPPRDHFPGRAFNGRILGVGVQEMGLQHRSTSRVKVAGFIHHGPCVLPRNRAFLQRRQCQRQPGCQGMGFSQQRPGGPFTDRQGTRDLGDQAHLLRDLKLC
jgi:hypothetical protein